MMSFLSPLRRRWIILALIFAAIVLNYVDRQILSILKPTLKAQFGFDDRGYALLVNVFTVCYAAMYPVAGWLVDRFGARLVMLLGHHRRGRRRASARASRTTLGPVHVLSRPARSGEPTAFPAQLRVVTTWFPGTLRATANSMSVAGGTFGAVIAPPLVAWLALSFDWHAAFIVPGVLGLVVAVAVVVRLSRSAGGCARAGHGDRRRRRAAFTWPQLWRTRTLWGILLIRFISDPVWYFCLFWLPGYLQENSGLTLAQVGMVGWIPFLAADLGGIASAAWSDRMVRRGTAPLLRAQTHAHDDGRARAALRAHAASAAPGGDAGDLQPGRGGVPELALQPERGDRGDFSHCATSRACSASPVVAARRARWCSTPMSAR